MLTKIKAEIPWIAGTAIVTKLLLYSMLGDLLFNDKILEIQLHDTYIVVSKLFLAGLTFFVLLLLMYFMRWIHARPFSKTITIFILVITTFVLIFLSLSWLESLEIIRVLGKTLYSENQGIDKVQMTLISHAAHTFALGVTALFGLIMAYKLVANKG